MKECFKCKEVKPLDLFYPHKQMSDGFLNKCKECTKKESKARHYEKYKDPNFVEYERARGREKYKRLNYKEKQKKWNENKPWKNNYITKNLNRNLKVKRGFEVHHWNYNLDFLKDVFIMERTNHRQLHTNLVFDEEKRIFKTKDGLLLNTKNRHGLFIESLGLKYEKL